MNPFKVNGNKCEKYGGLEVQIHTKNTKQRSRQKKKKELTACLKNKPYK